MSLKSEMEVEMVTTFVQELAGEKIDQVLKMLDKLERYKNKKYVILEYTDDSLLMHTADVLTTKIDVDETTFKSTDLTFILKVVENLKVT